MLERVGSTAAPLLAGVSFALVALVLQLKPGQVKWPDITLLLLVAAGLLLIASIQAILWADGDVGGWAMLAKVFYDVGILSLIASIGILLIPDGSISSQRWAVVALACLGFVLESIWVLVALLREAGSAHAQSDIGRWKEALDAGLTDDQILEIRKVLEDRHGVKSGRQALKFKKKHPDQPLGVALLPPKIGVGRKAEISPRAVNEDSGEAR